MVNMQTGIYIKLVSILSIQNSPFGSQPTSKLVVMTDVSCKDLLVLITVLTSLPYSIAPKPLYMFSGYL
jgi:hypothetical protein